MAGIPEALFQHTAARRRLVKSLHPDAISKAVSTHSRPKAAGALATQAYAALDVSTHSRPKAAGADAADRITFSTVSTHSRPKAAGLSLITIFDS